ncbi:MAG: FAD-dependent oxidoreductase [Planctomycetota bacterium]
MSGTTAVVGGGVTGLVLALRLCQRGHRVTLFDAQPEPGGLSIAARFPDFTWDRFYHVIAGGDQALLALLDELGLGGEVRWQRATQGVYLDGAVHPLVGPLDLLRLPRLSLLDKLRLGWFALNGHRARPDRELDHSTSADWARARCGEHAFDTLWRPLLRSKLGDAAPQIAARFLHATFRRLRQARGKGHREQFGYVRGGYRRVLDTLVGTLHSHGVRLRSGARVTAVQAAGRGATVQAAGSSETFDRVIVTLPNPQLVDVVKDLDTADRERLRATPYLGVACTVAVGRTPLSGHYILNLCDDGLAITGVIEMTAVVDRQHTGGRTLVYLPRYATADSEVFAAGDDVLADRALADLNRVLPETRSGWLLHRTVHRARLVQPLQFAGAEPHAPPREVVPGRVYCVSNACLPPGTLNNNDCIALATAAAEAL